MFSAIEATEHFLGAVLERCTFPGAGASVACAVSGGPDSTALLALACHAGCSATAYHVDHGLRPDSAAEAEVVEATAAKLGAGFVPLRVSVEPGPNLEARARAARYAVLPREAATGHTADDQAETVLLNLLRGSGLDGLAGMVTGPRHPILRLRRAETVDVCRRLGLTTVDDPSNTDSRQVRNRIRHEVLPLLAAVSSRDPVPVLVRQADLIRADTDYLDGLAQAIDVTDARRLSEAPEPLARRAVRRWLRPVLGGYPPDGAAVERVLAVGRGEVRAAEIAGGARVTRRAGRLVVTDGDDAGVSRSGH